MSGHLWRAMELQTPGGVIAVDTSGSGQFTRFFITAETADGRAEINTLGELADTLAASRTSAPAVASADPFGFAYLVCLLSGRRKFAFPTESVWPRLEQDFGLRRADAEPCIAGGRLQFVIYHFSPDLALSRVSVDLATLQVHEEPLARAPAAVAG